MGQIKHKMGKVGGGVDISHKSKMSGKAKSLMSFPGGMPGPGNYGSSGNKVVGKGMARYIAGESVGMRKMDPMHNGQPGVQQEDFEQFGSPKSTGPAKKKRKLTEKQQKLVDEVRAGRQAEADKKKKAKDAKNKANKELDTFLKAGGQINSGPGKYDDGPMKKKKGKLSKAMKDEAIANKKKIKGKGEKAGGPMKTDPKKEKKVSKATDVVVSGDKSKVSKKTTGMTSAEKKAEMKRRQVYRKQRTEAMRDSKKEESSQMRQVQKDKKANEKVQRQRKSEGKDYVKYKRGTSKDGGAKESVVVRKKLKE